MNSEKFQTILTAHGYDYFVGVPDSLLGGWLQLASADQQRCRVQIATLEGEALSLAMGYHLATGKKAVVFLQNSGLGNIINPLMSMAHADVYNIPMLLLIGWRGAPGFKDEPQHLTMGQATEGILKACQLPYAVIRDEDQLSDYLAEAHKGPRAVLIKPGQLSAASKKAEAKGPLRIAYLEALLELLPGSAALFATTGYTSRELWALQKEKPSHACFYSVGGMGFVSAIALGFAQQKSQGWTCILDGDGALLMHAGNLASIGASRASKLLHILFRNDVHESTGGQALAARPESYAKIAQTFGYRRSAIVEGVQELREIIPHILQESGPTFLEVKIAPGTWDGLPRPEGTPRDWLASFHQQMT